MFVSKFNGVPNIIFSYLENVDLLKIAKIFHDASLPVSPKIDIWISDSNYGEYLINLFLLEKQNLQLRMKPLFCAKIKNIRKILNLNQNYEVCLLVFTFSIIRLSFSDNLRDR